MIVYMEIGRKQGKSGETSLGAIIFIASFVELKRPFGSNDEEEGREGEGIVQGWIVASPPPSLPS